MSRARRAWRRQGPRPSLARAWQRFDRQLAAVDRLRSSQPRRAVRLALRAQRQIETMAERVTRGAASPAITGRWLQLEGRAWSAIGSCQRATARDAASLQRAEDSFRRALACFDGAHELAVDIEDDWARLSQRLAYLRFDQGHSDEGFALLRDASRGHRRQHRTDGRFRTLIDRAVLLGRAGGMARAVRLLERLLAVHSRGRQRMRDDTHLAAVHNLAHGLVELADSDPAQVARALLSLRAAIAAHAHVDDAESVGRNLNHAKLCAIVGRAAVRLGDASRGARLLLHAEQALDACGATQERASVLLTLLQLAVRRQQAVETHRVLGQLFPILAGLPADDPARAALLDVCRAMPGAMAERVTAASGTLRSMSTAVGG